MKTKYNTLTGCVAAVLALFASDASAQNHNWSDWSTAVHLSSPVNTSYTDGCPFIAKNELTLYFASNRDGGYGGLDIYVSQRDSVNDEWEVPVNLGPEINGPANDFCPTLTIEGHHLLFVSNRSGGSGGQDLYIAHRQNKRDDFGWEEAQNLGPTVNSASDDFTPSLFEDDATGQTILYFSSNRSGGLGGTDIYSSSSDSNGNFGPPAPVAELNTSASDQRPNVRKDGLEMFFDSDRPGSVGSFDLWTSTRDSTSDAWSLPVNLSSLNTGSVEGRPSLSFDGATLYFMSSRLGGVGGIDLYRAFRTKQKKH